MSREYKIFETNQFQKDLDKIKGRIHDKFYKIILTYIYPQLRVNPYYGNNIKKLKNWIPETWRYRTGNYRLFYEIDENKKIVFIIALEQRKNAY